MGGSATECTACPPGLTSPAEAERPEQCVSPISCAAGEGYDDSTLINGQDLDASILCTQCPPNFYGAGGRDACTACPDDLSSPAGSSSIDDCRYDVPPVCEPGFGYDGALRYCQRCAPGTFSTGGVDASCASCDFGQTANGYVRARR